MAGIAAGCGAPSGDGTKYKGIAPGADLVFVSTTLSDPTILDAIQYIYNYAHSVGKPCVINMSFGDGTYQLPAPGVYILRVDGFRARKVVVAN